MFKGHPKGLYVAFFANMGERFGYYTMLAIFTLYLQAKFGWDASQAGRVYGGFLFGIYFLPLLGGYIADNLLGYGRTIILGTLIMFAGYAMLGMPGTGELFIYGALAVISLGTGLFKGNLQALVGNLYDDPKYSKIRDSAFNIFYMGINIGAFFAPNAAEGISNWFLSKNGLFYNKNAADLAHQYLNNPDNGKVASELQQIADSMSYQATSLADFAHTYIDKLSNSYNYGFGIAALSMIVSLIIFVAFRKYYKHADVTHKQQKAAAASKGEAAAVEMSPEQTRQRLIALGLVFLVVVFFWMAFHQNGFTLTIFARDYTVETVGRGTNIIFNLWSFLPLIGAIIGLTVLFGKGNTMRQRLLGLIVTALGIGILLWVVYGGTFLGITSPGYKPEGNLITPQIFQQFNPIFIVFLTPVIVGFFAWLRKNGKEPSSPKKIGIGMILTAAGFGLMVLASIGLPSPSALQGGTILAADALRSPYWLIGTYFTLTIAELFLSPIGISFVSKVAPPQYKGLAQGGWLGATAIGNLAAGLIGPFWDKWELWQFFALLVGLCILSAIFIFSILKRLERATQA